MNAIDTHRLVDLLDILHAAGELPQLADPIGLQTLVGEVADQHGRQPGVGSLLRLWERGVQHLTDGQAPSAEQLAFMRRWFGDLDGYLKGELPSHDIVRLVQFPAARSWMPHLSPEFADKVHSALVLVAPKRTAARTDSSAVAADAVAAVPPAPDAAPAAPGPEASDDDAAFGDDWMLPAGDAAAAAATSDQPDIWISREELDLTLQAISEQLLDSINQWDQADDDALVLLQEDISYHSDLVVNVLDLVGTSELAEGMRAARDAISDQPPRMTAEQFGTWCVSLHALLQEPDADSAMLLATVGKDAVGLDDRWCDALYAEVARIRIGRDPTLKAQRKHEITEDDLRLTPADDVLPNVLEGMLRELPGNAAKLGSAMRAVIDEGDLSHLDEARRVAHTLKGDANTVGIRGLASLTHAMEDILVILVKQGGAPGSKTCELLTHATDTVEEVADHLLGRGPAPEHLGETCQQLLDFANALDDSPELAQSAEAPASTSTPAPVPAPAASAPAPAAAAPTAPAAPAKPAERPVAPALPSEMAPVHRTLTVDSSLLDEIQNLAGESMVTSRRIDLAISQMTEGYRQQRVVARNIQNLMDRLDDQVAMRGAALQSAAQREGHVDPLEIDQYNDLHIIARQLAEAQRDTSDQLRTMERTFLTLTDLRSEQEQNHSELQRRIMRTRMVPFEQITSRLQRIVRQTSKQVMKDVELRIDGEDTLLDAELLERIVEPLGHLLRNAIDHGIEGPQERQAAGKPSTAHLRIGVRILGDSALIDLADDGRGLNMEAIRRKAEASGLLPEEVTLTEQQLQNLVLMPGFSTREETSELSGRGVGMDVANQRIIAMRGSLQLDSTPGAGLTVRMRLPVSQTMANTIVARSGDYITSIVANAVQRTVRCEPGTLAYDADSKRMTAQIEGRSYQAIPMESLYDEGTDVARLIETGCLGLLVEHAAGAETVVLINDILDIRSVLVKPISAYMSAVPAVRGITRMADGSVAPVVDIDQMLDMGGQTQRAVTASRHAQLPCVLVADDSLSVRRSLQQLMEDAGYQVIAATDGVEAMALIEGRNIAAALLDMEMPRMNGLEVSRALRNRDDTRDIPVLMITSRSGEKHEQMALESGVTRMLTKPVQDEMLLELVARLLAEQAAVEA